MTTPSKPKGPSTSTGSSKPPSPPKPAGIPTAKTNQLAAFEERPHGTELTTDQGVAIPDTDNSLKAGARGPTLIEDFHLREKITRFDHERIPERVVHARGAGAHGHFQIYESLSRWTKAAFLQDPKAKTPVFVRFSTVVGSRGSADTVRDVRGFAVKFYTSEGNFDLVGNNMPVFFIQDGMKFPDLVHALKPDPRKEVPQASSAHDSFWDFVSLVPETAHMVMWVMSDRAIPRSYRMMEGFGVHTFRLVDAAGASHLVKFHWKPLLGVHGLVWEEAQQIAGKDADFHRRDLWDAIAAGAYPEYELGMQVVSEEDVLKHGFDLLDPTKLLPEELVPVERVGKLTLTRNPQNFFAEVEQVAFCVANLVPGIDVTDDPLMQARLFSYLDTQLTRLGGPNFAELPINRPLAPVHNNQHDGFSRQGIPTSEANYHPNSLAGGFPKPAEGMANAFTHVCERIDGSKLRARSDSFADHFGQAALFLNSLTPPERRHLTGALQFELSKVERLEVRQRVVDVILAPIDLALACEVAAGIGAQEPDVPATAKKTQRAGVERSPALSMAATGDGGIATRKVAALVANGFTTADLRTCKAALEGAGAVIEIVAPTVGTVTGDDGTQFIAPMSLLTTGSIRYDAVFVPGGAASLASLGARPEALQFVEDAFRHCKTIALGDGAEALLKPAQQRHGKGDAAEVGIVSGRVDKKLAAAFIEQIANHRHWARER